MGLELFTTRSETKGYANRFEFVRLPEKKNKILMPSGEVLAVVNNSDWTPSIQERG
ncbi:MAG TPA: hypothetical protein VJB08_06655 [Candidatus Nanoarchaeia archaeon]|nr:hypothetical protein [Candidatus Nanoarchaeia archaeon]